MKMVIFCRLLLKNTYKSTKVCGKVHFGKTQNVLEGVRGNSYNFSANQETPGKEK